MEVGRRASAGGVLHTPCQRVWDEVAVGGGSRKLPLPLPLLPDATAPVVSPQSRTCLHPTWTEYVCALEYFLESSGTCRISTMHLLMWKRFPHKKSWKTAHICYKSVFISLGPNPRFLLCMTFLALGNWSEQLHIFPNLERESTSNSSVAVLIIYLSGLPVPDCLHWDVMVDLCGLKLIFIVCMLYIVF